MIGTSDTAIFNEKVMNFQKCLNGMPEYLPIPYSSISAFKLSIELDINYFALYSVGLTVNAPHILDHCHIIKLCHSSFNTSLYPNAESPPKADHKLPKHAIRNAKKLFVCAFQINKTTFKITD